MNTYEQDANYLAAEQACVIREGINNLMTTVKTKPAPAYTFCVDSEESIEGYDAEFADMDNPRGAIYGVRYFMVAQTPEGRCYRAGWETSAQNAETFFQYFAPAVSEWPLYRCVYGSQAYQEENCEVYQMRDEMEQDLGSDWERRVSLDVATRLAV